MNTRLQLRRGVLALLLGAAQGFAQDPALAPVVEVAPVTRAAIAPRVRAPGTVVSTLDAAVAAEVDGRLVMVAAIGERVKQGQPVARIDDHVRKLQRETDQATIRRLQANLAYMERQQQRLTELASRNNMAQAELDQLRSQREMVAQEIEAAKVQLARTEYDIARAQVLAPFDGVIAARLQMPGEYTTAGTAVVRVVNTTALEITAQAPIAVTRHNREGAMVEVTGDFGRVSLPVRSLVPVGDVQSRMVEVRLAVAGADWVIGEPVEVLLASGPRTESIAVPRDALVLRKDATFVFRVDAAGVAHKIPVVAGEGDGGESIAVRGELEPDDRVVVLGGERLSDGQTVQVRSTGRVALR